MAVDEDDAAADEETADGGARCSTGRTLLPFPQTFSRTLRARRRRGIEDDDDDMAEDGMRRRRRRRQSPSFDLEWAAFERDLVQTLQQRAPDPQETYARATVAAEPELVPALEGLPGQVPAAEQEQRRQSWRRCLRMRSAGVNCRRSTS
jgi:hypothetical protein